MYTVKSIFYTLQGEGMNAGRPAIFLRFAGCNLWSGREEDRASAVCRFCDTDFLGGRKMTAGEVAEEVHTLWIDEADTTPDDRRMVVVTGGEPLLQFDVPLFENLTARGFLVALETNGTVDVPFEMLDEGWITVSPKAGAEWIQTYGDELKLVFPQPGLMPEDVEAKLGILGRNNFEHWLLQPMDGPALKENTARAIEVCKSNPRWRLSLQIHKVVGLP